MTQHAIDTSEAAKRTGRHYITSQTDSQRLTKTACKKHGRKIFPVDGFFASWGAWAKKNQAHTSPAHRKIPPVNADEPEEITS
jgi:hypothetical protein